MAVFASPDPALGTERLVLVAETRLQDEQALAALRGRIIALAGADLLGVPPDEVGSLAGQRPENHERQDPPGCNP